MSNKILLAWLHMPAVRSLGIVKQENYKSEANLSYTVLKPPPSKNLNNFLKFLIMKLFII